MLHTLIYIGLALITAGGGWFVLSRNKTPDQPANPPVPVPEPKPRKIDEPPTPKGGETP